MDINNKDYDDHDGNDSSQISKKSIGTIVYVTNIPFVLTMAGLMELFELNVGGVSKVYIFTKSKLSVGRGLIEFVEGSYAQKAIQKMNMYCIYGQSLIVRKDNGRGAFLLNKHSKKCYTVGQVSGFQGYNDVQSGIYRNEYGRPHNMANTNNISTIAVNKIFIGNLDFKVDKNKLTEIFSLAGEILEIEMIMITKGKKKAFAKITYNHPLEAVQAICISLAMFNNQILCGRQMTVRFNNTSYVVSKLPKGLEAIGHGLGPSGSILNVKDCLPKKKSVSSATNILDSEINAIKLEQFNLKIKEQDGDNNIIQENDNFVNSDVFMTGVNPL